MVKCLLHQLGVIIYILDYKIIMGLCCHPLIYDLPTDQTVHNRILLKVCCDVFTCRIRKSAAVMFRVLSRLNHNRILLIM